MVRVKYLFALLLFSATTAFACPGDAGEPLPSPDKLAVLERELARLAPECGTHAGYLAYRGAVLNALGRPAEAALLLEQALLLDPQRASAQIDYAEALDALGDSTSAAVLLREVLARPDVPAALRPRLEKRLNAMDVLRRLDALGALATLRDWAGTGWQSAGSVTFKLGSDNNLGSAPAHDTLSLTFPEGGATLFLADRFRPRAGMAALTEASGQVIRPLEGGAAIQFYGQARLRDSPSVSDTNFRQVLAGGAWSRPLASGVALFSVGASHLVYGGADLYRALRVSVSRDWQMNSCRPSLGLEGERRHYPAAPDLEGRFLGVSGGLTCSLGADRLALVVRTGKDAAQAGRAGGDQHQTDVRLVWTHPLGGGRLGADLSLSHQQDAAGYSPLLENGAIRRSGRASLYLEYAYPVALGWSVLASLENLAQRSNLPLFDINGRAFYVGVRWTK